MPEVSVSGSDPDPALPAGEVRRVVRRVLEAEGATDAVVSVAFIDPGEMRALNRRRLGKDRPTDVIAFRMTHEGRQVGDVYVCPAEARAAARRHGVPEREELTRLVIHGTLHVLGYDHPEGGARIESEMWCRQERYLRGGRC